MNKEEIQEYLKRVDELELKLDEEDKDTLQWLIFGYNECAKLLYEKEQELDRLNNVINELEKWLIEYRTFIDIPDYYEEGIIDCLDEVLDKLKELKEKNNGNLY